METGIYTGLEFNIPKEIAQYLAQQTLIKMDSSVCIHDLWVAGVLINAGLEHLNFLDSSKRTHKAQIIKSGKISFFE